MLKYNQTSRNGSPPVLQLSETETCPKCCSSVVSYYIALAVIEFLLQQYVAALIDQKKRIIPRVTLSGFETM